MKTCVKCEAPRAAELFKRSPNVCVPCHNKTSRDRRRDNKEKTRAMNRAQYYKHKERVRTTQKRYAAKIREKVRTDAVLHAKELIGAAKRRAKKAGLPFNITFEDIPIPPVCPVLGIPLKRNKDKMRFDSATVDRIVPALGYVKGNVIVISLKANAIKNNGTPEEILKVGYFFKLRDIV